jgi:hypothetical protein
MLYGETFDKEVSDDESVPETASDGFSNEKGLEQPAVAKVSNNSA